MPNLKRTGMALTATAVLAAGGVGLADAATKSKAKSSQSKAGRPAGNPAETVLTGDTKTQAEKAALDAVPGTVERSSAEDPAEKTGADYEVHVRKSDGSDVEVLLDSAFKVVKTQAGRGPGHGFGGPGGRRGGPGGNPNEKPLTGDTATKAKAAAVAKVGGKADFATAEDSNESTGAAYEVHVTKADGSHVTVLLDKDFNVLKTQADRGPGGRRGHDGPGGRHGGPDGDHDGPPAGPPPAAGATPSSDSAQYPGTTTQY